MVIIQLNSGHFFLGGGGRRLNQVDEGLLRFNDAEGANLVKLE